MFSHHFFLPEQESGRNMPLRDERQVTIFVGPADSGRKWELHEGALIHISDFFRAAFRSSFQESRDSILRLPEDDPRVFELFVAYINAKSKKDLTTPLQQVLNPPDGQKVTIRDYLGLYVFAAKYLVECLKREAIDLIYDYYALKSSDVDPQDAHFVYERTPEGCKLRKLLTMFAVVKMLSYKEDESLGWRYSLRHRSEFGRDIVSMICSRSIMPRGLSPPEPSGKCEFHTHMPGESCPSDSPSASSSPSPPGTPVRGRQLAWRRRVQAGGTI